MTNPKTPAIMAMNILATLEKNNREFSTGHPVHATPRLTQKFLRQDPPLDLTAILKRFYLEALENRAHRMAQYIGTTNIDQNKETILKTIEALTLDPKNKKITAQQFASRLNNLYSTVFTGHPCFSMNPKQAKALSNHFTHLASGEDENPKSYEALAKTAQLKYQPPNLDEESAQARAAIKNTHAAIDTIEQIAIQVAQKQYPKQWEKINYAPFTIATWIPFDWDGRADIAWNRLMEERILLQIEMLQDYITRLESFSDQLTGPDKKEITRLLSKINDTLSKLNTHHKFFRKHKQKSPPTRQDLETLTKGINAFYADTKSRITHPDTLLEPLQKLLDKKQNKQNKTTLVHLISRLKNHGITLAHSHFRMNAESVIANLREKLNKSSSNKGDPDKVYLIDVEHLLNSAKPVASNLIDTACSEETIYKQMTMIRQIIDHLDSHSPIRFLIAETESAVVPLTALAFAKELGVDKNIDICPLFEDRNGIDAAENIVKLLYANTQYRAYIEARGVAAFQLGYSDSGRYDGQPSAGAYMELVKGLILKQHKRYKLKNVDVCFFDTHGESPGRGAHPSGIKQRIAYNNSGFTINEAQRQGITLRSETSWQGGDGYQWHGTTQSSLAVLTQFLIHLTADHKAATRDPYYKGIGQKGALAIYERARTLHSTMAQKGNYAALISTFSALMPITGSRPVTRDNSSGGKRKLPRAIPHNGILAQLGIQGNVIYGLGSAIKDNVDEYNYLMQNSNEFRARMALAENSLEESDPYILKSYIKLYDPNFWQERARSQSKQDEKTTALEIAHHLSSLGWYDNFKPIVNDMIDDYVSLKESRLALNLKDDPLRDPAHLKARDKQKLNMQAVHGIRQAAIINFFSRAFKIHNFSDRYDINWEDLMNQIMNFDPDVFDKLEIIFGSQISQIDIRGLGVLKKSELDLKKTVYLSTRANVMDPMKEQRETITLASKTLMHMTPVGTG